MGRSGGAQKRHSRTQTIVRGPCTEVRRVQESLWNCLQPAATPTCFLALLPTSWQQRITEVTGQSATVSFQKRGRAYCGLRRKKRRGGGSSSTAVYWELISCHKSLQWGGERAQTSAMLVQWVYREEQNDIKGGSRDPALNLNPLMGCVCAWFVCIGFSIECIKFPLF